MNSQSLNLDSHYAQTFGNYQKSPKQVHNLFVITHLGQLKQMEALISKKKLANNGLVVLYTVMNFIVPQTVHDKVVQSLFNWVVFIEIPVKINQVNYLKLKTIHQIYQSLITASKPQNLYVNSFEGHYAILIDIAKKHDIKNILVEEGTATYKFNILNDENIELNIDYDSIKSTFKKTIGSTQLFKTALKIKKHTKELAGQTKKFACEIRLHHHVQTQIIHCLGGDILSVAFKPNKKFDKIYTSYPDLLESTFEGEKEYFLGVDNWSNTDLEHAQSLIDQYAIKDDDIIFLSQKYGIDPGIYVPLICQILDNITPKNKRIIVKLHPKESVDTLNLFQQYTTKHPKRFLILENPNFLIEPVLSLTQIRIVIGLTSSTLMYVPLLYAGVMSLSVAEMLISGLEKDGVDKQKIALIKEHLSIIRLFEKVVIL